MSLKEIVNGFRMGRQMMNLIKEYKEIFETSLDDKDLPDEIFSKYGPLFEYFKKIEDGNFPLDENIGFLGGMYTRPIILRTLNRWEKEFF